MLFKVLQLMFSHCTSRKNSVCGSSTELCDLPGAARRHGGTGVCTGGPVVLGVAPAGSVLKVPSQIISDPYPEGGT